MSALIHPSHSYPLAINGPIYSSSAITDTLYLPLLTSTRFISMLFKNDINSLNEQPRAWVGNSCPLGTPYFRN